MHCHNPHRHVPPSSVFVEKILVVALKLMEYLEVVMEEAMCQDSLRNMRLSNNYKSRSWRWLSGKQASNKSLAKVIEKIKRPSASGFTPTH